MHRARTKERAVLAVVALLLAAAPGISREEDDVAEPVGGCSPGQMTGEYSVPVSGELASSTSVCLHRGRLTVAAHAASIEGRATGTLRRSDPDPPSASPKERFP